MFQINKNYFFLLFTFFQYIWVNDFIAPIWKTTLRRKKLSTRCKLPNWHVMVHLWELGENDYPFEELPIRKKSLLGGNDYKSCLFVLYSYFQRVRFLCSLSKLLVPIFTFLMDLILNIDTWTNKFNNFIMYTSWKTIYFYFKIINKRFVNQPFMLLCVYFVVCVGCYLITKSLWFTIHLVFYFQIQRQLIKKLLVD